jgi:hypothetical protein
LEEKIKKLSRDFYYKKGVEILHRLVSADIKNAFPANSFFENAIVFSGKTQNRKVAPAPELLAPEICGRSFSFRIRKIIGSQVLVLKQPL